MKEYVKTREFEKAGEIKRQIFSLQHINDVALLKNGGQYTFEGTLGRSGDDGQRKFSGENFRGESEDTPSVGELSNISKIFVATNSPSSVSSSAS